MSEELKPCPWCGECPDIANDAVFRLTDGLKYGALQCCGIGPEVRTDYKPVAHWKDKAIEAWNDRPASVSDDKREKLAVIANGYEGGILVTDPSELGARISLFYESASKAEIAFGALSNHMETLKSAAAGVAP